MEMTTTMAAHLKATGHRVPEGYDPTMQNFNTTKKAESVEKVKTNQTYYVKEFKPRFSPIALAAANFALSEKSFLKTKLMKLVVTVGAFFEFVGRVKLGIVIAFCVDLYTSVVKKKFSLKFTKGNFLAMYDAGRMLLAYYKTSNAKEASAKDVESGRQVKNEGAILDAFKYMRQMTEVHGTLTSA